MTVIGMTCLRNEAPYIVDWIAHHRTLGMDHFLICSHDCEDGSDQLLDALANEGVVTHLPFEPSGDKTVQWQALKRLDKHQALKSYDWAIFFDLDEYLNLPKSTAKMADMLARCDDADGVAVPWRFHGSAGLEEFEDAPVTARFTWAAPRDLHYPLGHLFKSFIRPKAFRQLGVHRPRHKKNSAPRWRMGDGTEISGPVGADDKAITLYGYPKIGSAGMPVFNHYSLRSAEEFLLKRDRGLPNHADRELGADYWAERNWNTEEDGTIQRFAQPVAEERQRLMDLPGVLKAHERGFEWHKKKIKKLRQNIENVRFLWRLSLLSGSTPPDQIRVRKYIQDQMAARARNA